MRHSPATRTLLYSATKTRRCAGRSTKVESSFCSQAGFVLKSFSSRSTASRTISSSRGIRSLKLRTTMPNHEFGSLRRMAICAQAACWAASSSFQRSRGTRKLKFSSLTFSGGTSSSTERGAATNRANQAAPTARTSSTPLRMTRSNHGLLERLPRVRATEGFEPRLDFGGLGGGTKMPDCDSSGTGSATGTLAVTGVATGTGGDGGDALAAGGVSGAAGGAAAGGGGGAGRGAGVPN